MEALKGQKGQHEQQESQRDQNLKMIQKVFEDWYQLIGQFEKKKKRKK